jgi:hypothetical protein
VDGDRCTSHETRDGGGEKHSLQHGLLRFVFWETGVPMKAMASTARRRSCSAAPGRQEATKSVIFGALPGQVDPYCEGKKPRTKRERDPRGPANPFRNRLTPD